MITATLLFLVAVPADVPSSSAVQVTSSDSAALAAKPSRNATKSCREMLLSSSRLGAVKICKTRAEWRRWDDCNRSVTRYCTPEKKNERLYSEWKHDRMVCKDIKETGSRLSTQRVCSTAREWRLAEEEAQKTIRDRQNMSTLTNELGDGGNFTRPQ